MLVQLVLDELVGLLQQLRGQDDHRGGAVAHLLVLRELHDDLGGGVLDVELLEDGGAVVGDVADQHLVESGGAQRVLDDVGDGQNGSH